MSNLIIQQKAKAFTQNRPEIRPGFTVRVHERIQEGNKERVQVFEGLVINVHKGYTPTDSTFTVRRIVSGVGVEKVYSLHSPKIEKIEVKKVAKIRRAKLFFLRGRRGKAARLSERFTTAEEFAVAAETPVAEEEVVEEVAANTEPDTTEAEAAPDEKPADDVKEEVKNEADTTEDKSAEEGSDEAEKKE